MSIHLQQPDSRVTATGHQPGVAVRRVPLNANIALLLVLVLIIPTLSGVALIA